MRQSLAELADRHRMHISFVGSNAVVTTIAGEWYFNYNIRPIQLHHKNNERRTDCYGRSTGHYHIQNVHPETPLEAMAYIYHHERSVEHYFFAPNFEHEMQEPLEILNPSDGVREDSCCDELERITLNKRNAPCKH